MYNYMTNTQVADFFCTLQTSTSIVCKFSSDLYDQKDERLGNIS